MTARRTGASSPWRGAVVVALGLSGGEALAQPREDAGRAEPVGGAGSVAAADVKARAASGAARPAGYLAAGTRFATPYFVVRAERPGPTVLVVGGTHGNELASSPAATRVLDWTVQRGRLVVVPELNRPALTAGSRHTPGAALADLNRNFPTPTQPVRGELAPLLWRFTEALSPDWVLDLHEGWGFHRANPKTVGSSVTYVPAVSSSAAARSQAKRVLAAVNATIDLPHRQMDLVTPGPLGSFARSVSTELGIPSLVLETTRTGQPLWLRVSQQLLMVQTVLAELDMVVLRPRSLVRAHRCCLCPGPP